MAGQWERTKTPGVYAQEDRRGKVRYKAAFRDARGVVTSRTFPTMKSAKDYLADIRIRRRTNTLPDVSKAARSMSDLWEHFVKTYRGKPSTFASYEHRWRNHIQPVLGRRRLDSLRRSDIEEFYTDVERRTSLDTRRKVQQVVHKMLAVAVRSEWLVKNPANGIPMPAAVVHREPRVLIDAEVNKLADEVPSRYRALVYMLAETGARPGEITALRVKNLNGTVRIAEATVEVGGRKITGSPKTKGSIRNVPISPRLRAAIRDHYDGGFANRFDPESFVFTSERGTQISQSNLRNRVLRPAAERVGIEGFTTYDLRHTAISLWLMRGLSPWEVSRMVGHTTVAMIEQRYGHLYEHALQEKIDRLGETGRATS
ncbi:MAG: tyrosine-type recombinase/integrase [Actinomycetota bacterium]